MNARALALALTLVLGSVPQAAARAQSACARAPLAVQVLGSGGPHAGGSRASASYLVWRGGRAVALIDAGGGSFLRFGEAGAKLADLSLLAISHLHPDHVADLPALLWLSEQARQQPLKVAGPTAGGPFPAFDDFLRRLFDGGSGAFPVLAGTLGQAAAQGPGQGVRLDPATVNAAVGTVSPVHSDSVLEVSAIGVPHANVPALAFRVRAGGRTLVFGSDQNGSDARFAEFAADADVLVLHLAISQQAPDLLARVHARPATVGEMAARARAKRLVLSHVMQAPPAMRTPEWLSAHDLDAAVAEVRRRYTGPVEVGEDLKCIEVR